MKIEVSFTPAMNDAVDVVRGRTVVVIDTLRATSTIIAAMMAGAREVVPVASAADAVNVAHRLGVERALLCGERGSVRVPGFPLGNSPREYSPDGVAGNALVLSTTNGTLALLKAQHAETVLCGALLNARAVAEEIVASRERDVHIGWAGTMGRFSVEDAITAGAIIEAASEFSLHAPVLDDAARASLLLFDRSRNDLRTALFDGDHGARLVALGLDEDIEFCARLDVERAPVP